MTMNVLRLHGRAAWVVPEYKNGRALWRYANSVCAPLAAAGYMSISKSERIITTHAGGFFGIYSADNIDAIRSEAFNLLVGDEAARIGGEGWQDAARPTLADANGDEILISTPKGKNWFYTEWMRGVSNESEYMSWTAPTSANPIPNIRKAFDMARERVSERTFRQEWQAEFVEDGALFRNVAELSTLKPQEPEEGRQYIIGVDWGRVNDATVFSVWDIQGKRQAWLDRMTGTDYESQRGRLEVLSKKYNRAGILAEANSMGQPNIEALHLKGLPVMGFTTTNSTKAQVIQNLEMALERKEIALIDNDVQKNELMSYQSEKLPSGLVRYSAPVGMHDDTVMAAALGLWGISSYSPIPNNQPEQKSKWSDDKGEGWARRY